MEIVLEILTVIVCILLIGVVLIQDSKGGGLTSSFSGSNQILGVRRTSDFLEKATWVLAIALLVFSLASSFFAGGTSGTTGISSTKDKANDINIPQGQQQQRPSAPATGGAPAPTK
jgi:preprotein translocase subunit SecG